MIAASGQLTHITIPILLANRLYGRRTLGEGRIEDLGLDRLEVWILYELFDLLYAVDERVLIACIC
jgi:hypothetical protein